MNRKEFSNVFVRKTLGTHFDRGEHDSHTQDSDKHQHNCNHQGFAIGCSSVIKHLFN